jgi:hypothetical protein
MVVVLLSYHHHRHPGSADEGAATAHPRAHQRLPRPPRVRACSDRRGRGPHVHRGRIYNCVAGAETHRKHAPCMTAVRGSLRLGCTRPFRIVTAYAIRPHVSTAAKPCTNHIWRATFTHRCLMLESVLKRRCMHRYIKYGRALSTLCLA